MADEKDEKAGGEAPAKEKPASKEKPVAAEKPVETKWAALKPRDPQRGLLMRTYSARGFDFVAGGPAIEVPADLADYLATVENPQPKGAESGAKAFVVTAKKPAAK